MQSSLGEQAGELLNVHVSTTYDYTDPLSFEVDAAIEHACVGQGSSGLDEQLHGLGEELHSVDEL